MVNLLFYFLLVDAFYTQEHLNGTLNMREGDNDDYGYD
jgi:hypothetical protein